MTPRPPLRISVSGVRGVAGEALTPGIVTSFAAAFGTYVGAGPVAIGTDTRPSREMVSQAALAGLLSVGCTPVDLGIVPVPALQHFVRGAKAVGGICATASHHTAEWNALKFFDKEGMVLRPNQFTELLDLYHQDVYSRVGADGITEVVEDGSAAERHREAILGAVDGCPIEEVTPGSLRHLMRYVRHLRSTWDSEVWEHRPHFLGLSDGSEYNWVGAHVLAFFASQYRNPVAQLFFDESYADAHLDSLSDLQALGEPIASAEPDLPPAWIYRDQPMVFFRTGWRPGDSLVCLNSIRHVTCHGHRDRGSVIFEYGGEQLLLDPGMIGYSDPAGIDWAVADFAAVYPEAQLVHRHLVFLRPDVCILYDEVEAFEDQEVWLNFTCLGELSETDGGHLSATDRNRLLIATIATGPIDYDTTGWSTHWPEIPAHRLVARTPTTDGKASVLTVLAAGPVEESSPQAHVRSEAGALSASIETSTHQAWVVYRTEACSGVEMPLVETDGRAASDAGQLVAPGLYLWRLSADTDVGEYTQAGTVAVVY